MKNEPKILYGVKHDIIPTRHVFAENNQVFLKKDREILSRGSTGKVEWSPINFQWIPAMKLHENLRNQSKKTHQQ